MATAQRKEEKLMPILPRFNRLRKRPDEQRLLDDRATRKSQEYYLSQGYNPAFAERQAGIERELSQAIKRRRGLRGVKLTGAGN
jgi:hypothetical protein